jgi:Cysteine rich repeat
MLNTHVIAAGLLLAALCAGAARAQSGLPPEANLPAVKAAAAACAGDIKSFCPGVVPGEGRIVRCLASNAASLGPTCKSSMLAAKSALGR